MKVAILVLSAVTLTLQVVELVDIVKQKKSMKNNQDNRNE